MKAYDIALKYFKGDELAASAYINKYALKDKDGNILEPSPDDMHKRLAKAFYNEYKNRPAPFCDENLSEYGQNRVELTEESIYELLKDFRYIIPGGSVMEGAGTNNPVSLSNCFFNGTINDDINSIFDTAKSLAQLGKRRGGTSTDLSYLRPRGANINNAARESSGAVSWMSLYDTVGKLIGQQGRKMAMMISMSVDHPDIEEFIDIKRNKSKVTNANISVKLNDRFINAVNKNIDYYLRWPIDKLLTVEFDMADVEFEYNKLYTDSNGTYFKKVKARDLWNKLIHSAWESAEPGILNWDRVLEYDPTSVYPELRPEGVNPCAELPLATNDSCRLLAVNLFSLVENPFTENAHIDYKKAYELFYEAQILCDVIVDMEIKAVENILTKLEPEIMLYPIKWLEGLHGHLMIDREASEEFKLWWKIRRKAIIGRRTGTGITGYADMLAALGEKYGDFDITYNIFNTKLEAELDASIDLAIKYGAFPCWKRTNEYVNIDGDDWGGMNEWYTMIMHEYPKQFEKMIKYGRRNAGISTCAPTGTISLLAGCTSGIEPLFKPFYIRRKKSVDGDKVDFTDENGIEYTEHLVVHSKLKTWLSISSFNGIEQSDDFQNRIEDLEYIKEVFKESPWYKQTAEDLSSELRVDTQALIQNFITASISSTVNVPNSATVEDVNEIYTSAFEKGCKGITVYREGSRSGILVDSSTKRGVLHKNGIVKRPKSLEADYYQIKANGVNYIVLVGLLDNSPYEIFVFEPTEPIKQKEGKGFITKIKKGHYNFDSEFLNVTNLQLAADKVEERACSLYASMLLRHGAEPKYVIKTTKKVNEGIVSFASAMCRVLAKYTPKELSNDPCPNCGEKLIHQGGCTQCTHCDYSGCS